jgi:organic hydroperoxide reductase OsmC/OhrA
MAREHHFAARLVWTGAERSPTRDYQSYSREYRAEVEGKPPLVGSSDPKFRGDASKHNPEDMLVIALSACHMLSYLAACAQAGIEVVAYEDQASALHDKAHDDCFIANSVNFPVLHVPTVIRA